MVIDAGIVTEDNLNLLRERGYNYLCVSRKRLKDYELKADGKAVIVHDCRKREIRLREVEHKEGGDYYLQINSPTKELKESSMKRQFRERFESELQKAKDALTKKGGTKVYDKVVERVGRAMGRYPSIAKFYEVTYTRSTKKRIRCPTLHGVSVCRKRLIATVESISFAPMLPRWMRKPLGIIII